MLLRYGRYDREPCLRILELILIRIWHWIREEVHVYYPSSLSALGRMLSHLITTLYELGGTCLLVSLSEPQPPSLNLNHQCLPITSYPQVTVVSAPLRCPQTRSLPSLLVVADRSALRKPAIMLTRLTTCISRGHFHQVSNQSALGVGCLRKI